MFIYFATATAVMHYNVGYELSNPCDKFGIATPSSLMKNFKKDNKIYARIKIKKKLGQKKKKRKKRRRRRRTRRRRRRRRGI